MTTFGSESLTNQINDKKVSRVIHHKNKMLLHIIASISVTNSGHGRDFFYVLCTFRFRGL